jgi:hypothetical protein
MMNVSTQSSIEPLMNKYVTLCNRAIAENEDKFWYQQAKKLNRAIWNDGARFRTLVYGDNPKETQAQFTLHFDVDRHELSLGPDTTEEDVAFTWKTPVSYLQDVVEERPDWYLEHPVRLDWQWLKARANDSLEHSSPRSAFASGFVLGAFIFMLGYYAASCLKKH